MKYIEDKNGRKMYYKFTPAKNPSKSPLLVILHGHTHNAKPSKYYDEEWNVLVPIDNFGVNQSGSWWLGEKGDFFVKDLLHDLVKKYRKNSNDELFIWGSSMGGFGALLHGCLLNASAVYANIPQVKLIGTTYSKSGMNKFFEPIFEDQDESCRYNDVTNFLNFEGHRESPVFFVAQTRFDYEKYLEEHSLYFFNKCLEKNINIHYEVFPTGGHKVILPLHEAVEKMRSEYRKVNQDTFERKEKKSVIDDKNFVEESVSIDFDKVGSIFIKFNSSDGGAAHKAFRLLLNGKTIFESKYTRENNIRVPVTSSGTYRAVCLFKDKERLLSKNIVLKTDDFLSGGIISLRDRVRAEENKLKYIYSKEKEKYEELILNKKELFNRTKAVEELIGICRMEKKMHSRYTDFSRECARIAFQTKPCEKTLYFYLESHILNSSFEKAKKILDDVRKNYALDERCVSMIKLHEASLYILNSDWISYNKGLVDFKKNHQPGIYWQSDLVVDDFDFGSNDKKLAGRSVALTPIFNNPEYIVSISCDYNYLVKFGKSFLQSFGVSCSQEGAIHIFLVNCKEKDVRSLFKEWGVDEYVTASYFNTPDGLDFRPVSATLRLIAIHDLLNKYNVPVLFSEIDCVFKESPSCLIETLENGAHDQLVRSIGAILPWQRYTCGFGVYMPTKKGIGSAGLLKQYCLGLFNSRPKLMWADQCALEASIRYSNINANDFRLYSPSLSEINDIVFTPTGSIENKIYQLNEMFLNISSGKSEKAHG